MALVGGGWWFGVGLPANRAAEARAAEQAKTAAAEKKKEEDSAAFWAQVARDNKAKSEKAAADAAAFNASQATRQSDSVKRRMEAQGWTQFAGDFYYQYADKSEYTCGYSNCSYVHVTTMAPNGCAGGLYRGCHHRQGKRLGGDDEQHHGRSHPRQGRHSQARGPYRRRRQDRAD